MQYEKTPLAQEELDHIANTLASRGFSLITELYSGYLDELEIHAVQSPDSTDRQKRATDEDFRKCAEMRAFLSRLKTIANHNHYHVRVVQTQ